MTPAGWTPEPYYHLEPPDKSMPIPMWTVRGKTGERGSSSTSKQVQAHEVAILNNAYFRGFAEGMEYVLKG